MKMVSVDDFPDPHDPKAEIFIQWVRLCEIIGRVGKAIARGEIHATDSVPRKDLMNWPQALSPDLQLPISDDRTVNFNREIHMLHLPYLATTVLLNLQKTSEKLPRASMVAMIAASCVSRILQDILGHGTLRYLPGQTGWYISVSIIALLYARNIECLAVHANDDIAVLFAALKEMSTLWHSSKMFHAGFERIIGGEKVQNEPQNLRNTGRNTLGVDVPQAPPVINDISVPDDESWKDSFPYVTTRTSPLISVLLENAVGVPFTGMEPSQMNFMFEFLDDLDPEYFQLDPSL